MLRSLPERQSLNYAAVRPKALDLILSLTRSSPEAADAAIDGLIRSRALVLDEMAARHRSQRTAFESTDPLRIAFASAQQRLANLVVRGPGHVVAGSIHGTAGRRTARERDRGTGAGGTERRVQGRTQSSATRPRRRKGITSDGQCARVVRSLQPHSFSVSRQRLRTGEARYLRAPCRRISLLSCARSSRRLSCRWVLHRRSIHLSRSGGRTLPLRRGHRRTASGRSARSSRMSGLGLEKLVWDRVDPSLG